MAVLTITRRAVLLDAACIAAACLIPALSHLTALPLYRLDPMLWIVAAALVATSRHRLSLANLVGVAVLMPFAASLLVGMPSLAKALCMSAELVAFAVVARALLWRAANAPRRMLAVLAAVVASKAVYYGLKALILAPAALVGVPVAVQAVVAVAVAVAVALLLSNGRK